VRVGTGFMSFRSGASAGFNMLVISRLDELLLAFQGNYALRSYTPRPKATCITGNACFFVSYLRRFCTIEIVHSR
jgi:hypothetical protein